MLNYETSPWWRRCEKIRYHSRAQTALDTKNNVDPGYDIDNTKDYGFFYITEKIDELGNKEEPMNALGPIFIFEELVN